MKGWIAINAGGRPKQAWVTLDGSREPNFIIPVMATHEEASRYWFSQSPEKAWALQEVIVNPAAHAPDAPAPAPVPSSPAQPGAGMT